MGWDLIMTPEKALDKRTSPPERVILDERSIMQHISF